MARDGVALPTMTSGDIILLLSYDSSREAQAAWVCAVGSHERWRTALAI